MADSMSGAMHEVTERAGREATLSSAAWALFRPSLGPAAFVEQLASKGLYEDALIFTAHALPARDLVWWGCLCAWHGARPTPPPREADAFRAALRWIQKPNDDTRRAAERAAQEVGLEAPAALVALAAFYSGGNVAPRGTPPIEAAMGMAARVLIAGLRVAAARENLTSPALCFERYLRYAEEPLRRLSTPATRKSQRGSAEGSIASRWSEDAVEPSGPGSLSAAPPLAGPPTATKTLPAPTPAPRPSAPNHESRPRPAPPNKPESKRDDDRDAWEGLSKLEDE